MQKGCFPEKLLSREDASWSPACLVASVGAAATNPLHSLNSRGGSAPIELISTANNSSFPQSENALFTDSDEQMF